jgi:potassium-transporting ATPase KdpC subunit
MRPLLISIRLTVVLTVLLGLIYPLAITGVAQLLFPFQANGSIVTHGGKPVGSELIGQNFAGAGYFHPRPSAAGDKGYDASNSGGSNLGPSNKALIEAVRKRIKDAVEAEPGIKPADIPIDFVTTSASGLDPEISPAAAEIQIARVAQARGIGEEEVRMLVGNNTRARLLGLFGEPGVNVLMLNLALDKLAPVHARAER